MENMSYSEWKKYKQQAGMAVEAMEIPLVKDTCSREKGDGYEKDN